MNLGYCYRVKKEKRKKLQNLEQDSFPQAALKKPLLN
ncbi:hypothetical protein SAL_0228 [Streptococcus agalactiae 515]|nr:hypothetical protein SAL_0228 [Streptococcus agalactiae 515]